MSEREFILTQDLRVANRMIDSKSTELHRYEAANKALLQTNKELLEALKEAREAIAGFPRSLAYDITHLPKIDAAIHNAEDG